MSAKDGEPYQPSNSSDGCLIENTCAECQNDKAFRDGGYNDAELGCNILADMYANGKHKAWVYKDGQPICTEFIEEGTQTITQQERAAQIDLPLGVTT